MNPPTGQAIYLTDFDRCQPQSALHPFYKRHGWRILPYETDTLTGTMLMAGEESAAPDVAYPLNVSGWHHIAIGLYNDHSGVTAQVKLTDDSCFSPMQVGVEWDQYKVRGVIELYWKAADLTGQHIHFGQLSVPVGTGDQPAANRCYKAQIAYIKLVPLSDEEARAVQADRQRTDARRLFAHNDADGYLYLFRGASPEGIRREIEPYRHTDFSRLYWEAGGGDIAYYLTSQVGRIVTCDGEDDFERTGYRLTAESYRVYRAQGLDPLRFAADYAHEIGLEFHASYRTAFFYLPPPYDHFNWGGFYEKHPELRMLARDGRPVPRISYTFPETRRFVIAMLREIAQYPVDGICLLYNRRPPLVGYEPPLVEGFRQQYGADPRQLDEHDPRWLAYRCTILTQFMRDLRREMDAVAEAQRRSKRIAISAVVLSGEAEHLQHGMDVRAWVAEGLVDTLIPYTSIPGLDSGYANPWTNPQDVAYFVALTKGTPCQLAINIMPRYLTPEDYRRKAAMLYRAGVENLFFWDAAGVCGRANYGPSWSALRRLGHRDEIEAWRQAGEPNLTPSPTTLRRWGDYDLTYQTPG